MITEKRKKRLAEMLSIMRDDKISREVKDKVMDVYFNEFLGGKFKGFGKTLSDNLTSHDAFAAKLLFFIFQEFLGADYVKGMDISKNLIAVVLSPKALTSNLEDWVPCCTQAKWVVDSLDKAEFKMFMS